MLMFYEIIIEELAYGYCQRTPQWEEIENDDDNNDDNNNNNNNNNNHTNNNINNNNNKFEKIGVCYVFEHNFGGYLYWSIGI